MLEAADLLHNTYGNTVWEGRYGKSKEKKKLDWTEETKENRIAIATNYLCLFGGLAPHCSSGQAKLRAI